MTTPDGFDPALSDDRVMTDTDRRTEVVDDERARGAVDDRRTPNGLAPERRTDAVDNGRTADEPLVAEEATVDYRARWKVIQQGFVDDPRNSVSEADHLVDDVLKHLSGSFDRQRQGLEQQWSDGEPSTEDLRSALQRYRAFFQRLLTL